MPKSHPKPKISPKETAAATAKPRRRFSPITRLFIAIGLLAIGWLLTGIILESIVQSAMTNRNLTKAIRWARVASWLRPWDGDLKLIRARASRLKGDLDAWSAQMEPLANQSAESSIARELQFGKIQLGAFPDAYHALMEKMLDAAPASEVAEAFVIGLLAKHDRENSRKILDAWKLDEPQNPEVEFVEAVYEEALDNRREALTRLVQFCAAHPYHQSARLRLANLLLADRRYEAALAELTTLSAQGDDSASTLTKLARCHRLLGDAAKAKSLVAAFADSAESSGARLELAHCQLELGEYAAAAKTLRASGVERLTSGAQTDLALADYLSGRPDTAESIYAAIGKARQLQSRRADLEVYLLLNPDDEKARRELETVNEGK